MLDRSINILSLNSDISYNRLDSNPIFLFQHIRIIHSQLQKLRKELENAN